MQRRADFTLLAGQEALVAIMLPLALRLVLLDLAQGAQASSQA